MSLSSPNSLSPLGPPVLPTPAATLPLQLAERDSYTTVSVVASDSASTSAATASKKAFPFAVAIPALVGGMALAVGAFFLWWWMSKRRKRQRREQWERNQRRKRNKANAQTRPSVSSSRTPSSQKSPISEKHFISPIPALPKTKLASAPDQNPFQEDGHGYGGPTSTTYAHGHEMPAQNGRYDTQPYIEQPAQYSYDQYGNAIPLGAYGQNQEYDSSIPLSTINNPSGHTNAPLEESVQSASSAAPASAPAPKSGKRAAARMAVAETAAANASVDPAYRHRPNKPSPLALKAAAAAEAEEKARNSTGFRIQPELAAQLAYEAEQEEMLAPDDAHRRASAQGNGNGSAYVQGQGRNAASGEWGVALGSPNNDASFANQQYFSASPAGYTPGATPAQSRYKEDPYLSSARAPSGQYSMDPYAGYHPGGAEAEKKAGGWL